MRKDLFKIVSIILMICVFGISCKKNVSDNDSDKMSIVGYWESSKIDSTTEFVIPNNGKMTSSSVCVHKTIEINGNGTFVFINNIDTINGKWNQFKPDSISFTNDSGLDAYVYPSKFEFLDNKTMTLNYSFGYIEVGGGMFFDTLSHKLPIAKQILYEIKTTYKRR